MIRILPFGGKVVRVSMDGALLVRVLETGVNNQGTGGYLQVRGASFEQGRWQVRGAPIDPARRYAVALNDFLLSGGEVNLGFLTRSNPQVHDIVEGRDVRLALIDELKR